MVLLKGLKSCFPIKKECTHKRMIIIFLRREEWRKKTKKKLNYILINVIHFHLVFIKFFTYPGYFKNPSRSRQRAKNKTTMIVSIFCFDKPCFLKYISYESCIFGLDE